VIVLDQVPKLLGIYFDKGGFLQNVLSLIGHLPQTSLATLAVGAAMLVILVALERFAPRTRRRSRRSLSVSPSRRSWPCRASASRPSARSRSACPRLRRRAWHWWRCCGPARSASR